MGKDSQSVFLAVSGSSIVSSSVSVFEWASRSISTKPDCDLAVVLTVICSGLWPDFCFVLF